MINLDIIIEALEFTSDESTYFFDRKTNDTVLLSEYSDDYSQLCDMIDEDEDDRFLPLPSQREINEYGMMEDFIDTLPDGDQKYTLAMSINGRGAFRRFKDTIIRFNLEDSWYTFRDKAYARVARRWCEENDVEYYQKGTGVPLEELLEDIAEDEDEPVDVVKIDKEALSTAGGLENILKGLFADSGIDIKVDEEDLAEKETYTITPAQLGKYHDIYQRLSALQGEIEDLADEVSGPVGEVLDDASSHIEDALDRLDEDVHVEIVVDGKTYEGIGLLTELLKRLKEDKG